jgi:uncharacterized membrane protein YdjX (TVP38/TMEM64 family)
MWQRSRAFAKTVPLFLGGRRPGKLATDSFKRTTQRWMGILPAQAPRSLLGKGLHGRLRLLIPTVVENGESCSISVHSKVLVIDDCLAKIGSSILSSRSMAGDTGCGLERAVPLPLRRRSSRRWLRLLLIGALVGAAWLASRHWAGGAGRLQGLVGATLAGIADKPAGTLLVALFYALAGVLFVPVTLLATTTLAVFGLWPGVGIAWSGGLLGAMLSHAIGKRLGPRVAAWLPSQFGKSVGRFLERRSFWAVVFMRIVPFGNFGALNLAAGALGVKRRSFILGNMVGLLPGLFGLGVVVNRALALLSRPTALNVSVFVVVAGVLVVAPRWVRRRYRPGPIAASAASTDEPTTQTGPVFASSASSG